MVATILPDVKGLEPVVQAVLAAQNQWTTTDKADQG